MGCYRLLTHIQYPGATIISDEFITSDKAEIENDFNDVFHYKIVKRGLPDQMDWLYNICSS